MAAKRKAKTDVVARVTDALLAQLGPPAFAPPRGRYGLPPVPKNIAPERPKLAQDDATLVVDAWANNALLGSGQFVGVGFLGFQLLSELAQRPEYRSISEVLATEATRKWIKFQSVATGRKKPGTKIAGREYGGVADPEAKDDKGAKEERIKQLEDEFKRLAAQDVFRRVSELDGFFGRAHLYLDTGDTDNPEELLQSIGDGQDGKTKAKVARGSLRRLAAIEPMWTYPAEYNANDPLRADWYNPQVWYVLGKRVHVSRCLRFVAREVPDMLKPSYMFGGVSLSQLCQPYVENWLKIRQAVANAVWSFSTSGVKTDMNTLLQADGDQLLRRVELFNRVRNNNGLMLLNKEAEEFFQFNMPLSTLDALQAQAQEHMCSVSREPVIKLLGISPHGLNASTEGELEVWYDNVEAYQERFFTRNLTRVMHFAMMSLWGEVDPDITFAYESLRSDDPVQKANAQKTLAETDDILIAAGVIHPEEARTRLAADAESGYDGIDVDDLPEPPEGEENIDIRGTERPPQFVDKEAA